MHLSFLARRGLLATAVVGWLLLAPRGASAADRARLSADLAADLAAGSASIDVIVHGTRAQVDTLAGRYNLPVTKYLKTGAVLRVTAGQLAALQVDGSQDHLSSDILIRSTADLAAETILADRAWSGLEGLPQLSGAGIGVAVIDSGVDISHAALRDRVLYSKDFTGGDGKDRYGHGTHVAALIAGQAGDTMDSGHRGMAFGAHIISLRVLDAEGAGKASNVIEAIDWAIDHRDTYKIRIINLSLGAPVLQPYRDDPLCEAVERAVAAGMFVVAAAGNNGLARDGSVVYGAVTSPGNDPGVITVGALDAHGTPDRFDDTVAGYSSRGPTAYDLVQKPDLVAPGTRVVSAEAAGSYLLRTYPERHVEGTGASAYMQLSGTSMAAGVVSGALALLLEQNPQMTASDAKAILRATCSPMPEGPWASGSGSVNVLAAAQLVQVISVSGASEPAVGTIRRWRIAGLATEGTVLVQAGNGIIVVSEMIVVGDLQTTESIRPILAQDVDQAGAWSLVELSALWKGIPQSSESDQ